MAGIQRTLAFLGAGLGDTRFAEVWSSGAALSLEQAAQEGLSA
jgi:hypothetical protein